MKKWTAFILFPAAFLCSVMLSHCQLRNEAITTFYLVRHAEKAVDGTEDPDLSESGQQRALKLASMLKDKKVERLYATSYKRTQQTLQPLADALSLEVQIYDHGDAASTEQMIADCKGTTAVIAGHTNSTPQLANILIGKEVYTEIDEGDYTQMWQITQKGNRVIEYKTIQY